MSLYQYVLSNPVRGLDPQGTAHWTFGWPPHISPPPPLLPSYAPDPAQFATLQQRLERECAKLGTPEEQSNCREEAARVVEALKAAQAEILKENYPHRFSYLGPVCTDCESITITKFPNATDYFRYYGKEHTSPWIFGDHAWGEIQFGDERIVTIDFWSDIDSFWAEGPNGFGWIDDEDKPKPRPKPTQKDRCYWYGRFQ